MGLTFNIKDIHTLEKNIRAGMRKYVNRGMAGLVEIGEEIMERSYEECPKETGALADSGFVEVTEHKDTSVSVRLGYGGKHDQVNPITGKATSTYMVPVHERMDLAHPTGKAKFLEDPINAKKAEMEAKLAQRMRE